MTGISFEWTRTGFQGAWGYRIIVPANTKEMKQECFALVKEFDEIITAEIMRRAVFKEEIKRKKAIARKAKK